MRSILTTDKDPVFGRATERIGIQERDAPQTRWPTSLPYSDLVPSMANFGSPQEIWDRFELGTVDPLIDGLWPWVIDARELDRRAQDYGLMVDEDYY